MRPQRVAELRPGDFTFRTEGADMKFVRICAVGAFLCGPSFCHAQIQFFDSLGDTKSILVSTEDSELRPSTASGATRTGISQAAEISIESDPGPFPYGELSPSDEVTAVGESESGSVPVGAHHRRRVVDQILLQGALAQVPNAAIEPVAWPAQMPHYHNPTGNYLLASRCANGLWLNYPAEQAAECARIQSHLMAHHHAGCAACGNTGCAPTCDSGNCQPAAKFNRYTNSYSNCDAYSAPIAQACSPSQHASQQFQPSAVPVPPSYPAASPVPTYVPALIEAPVLEQPTKAAGSSSAGKVASLPSVTR
jgi:hypothetical protein